MKTLLCHVHTPILLFIYFFKLKCPCELYLFQETCSVCVQLIVYKSHLNTT